VKNAQELVVALAGNPNSGKTSVFNNLTGARQHVGNWPGVTVEKKEGSVTYENFTLRIIDLPGTYSLGAYSEDEAVASDFILFGKPDVIINVVDSTNLVRNLYLTTQIMEMGIPFVVALNMSDELARDGIQIDIPKLSEILGAKVIPTVASRGKGMAELIEASVSAANNPKRPQLIDYGPELEREIRALAQEINPAESGLDPRVLAVKLLEGSSLRQIASQLPNSKKLFAFREKALGRLKKLSSDLPSFFADRRYDFIGEVVKKALHQQANPGLSVSDRIDGIVTSRFFGIPIFILLMWCIFQFTFKLGAPMVDLIDQLFKHLGDSLGTILENAGASRLIISFIKDGIIGGVGSVLVFIPNLALLFFAISLLEDSGYLARAAFIMDRLMRALGLHGKSFLPLLIGFGCNVPGIMATRTLESKRDRMITIFINPLISCSGRLPIYLLFTGALFSAKQGMVVFSLYVLGLVLAILMGTIFRKFLFKGAAAPFVLELPPYRIPSLKSTLLHTWERVAAFLQRASTIIFSAVVLIWVLANVPVGVAYASRESLLGRIGSMIAPLLEPAGFGNWQAAVALLFGVIAKELVVSTLGLVHGVEEAALTEQIAGNWTPLAAYAFMAMNLLYIPCVATIGAIRRETNSWPWTLFAIGYSLLLGWTVATLIYQLGSFLGFA
jgi:ferrous iron transport protein B